MLTRLAARRSAWNAADIRGEVEQLIAAATSSPTPRSRLELAEDLTARALARVRAAARPRRRAGARPRAHLAPRARRRGRPRRPARRPRRRPGRRARRTCADAASPGSTPAQRDVVAALAGDAAAGRGRGRGRRRQDHHPRRRPRPARAAGPPAGGGDPDVEGGPGRRARDRRASRVGGVAGLPARLALGRAPAAGPGSHSARSTRSPAASTTARARTRGCAPGDLLLVDEAGMLDQDTARALLDHRRRAPAPGSRWSATGTSCPRSAAAASSTSPPLGRPGRVPRPWTRCTGSPAPTTTPTADARAGQRVRRAHASRCGAGDDPGAVFDALLARGQIQRPPQRAGPARRRWPTSSPLQRLAAAHRRRGGRHPRAGRRAQRRDPRPARRRRPRRRPARVGHPRPGSGSAPATGSRPAATTATSAWPTATPGPSPPSARATARSPSPSAVPAGHARMLPADYVTRACRARLRHHRARRARRHRHHRAPGDRRAHRRRVGLRRR